MESTSTQLPDVPKSYTEYQGKRCSMPVLADAYGL
jgi:multiple sugar transport system substrate-binding protein